ncbi:unnamed protein product [Rhizophagus irregularis]|nr:unnamed protein product [Rhizophagus irregularis]
MRYSKGQNQGNLISPFLQKKALDFVNSSLYKAGQNSNSLIQDNKVLQKQITKLERSNAKKSHKRRYREINADIEEETTEFAPTEEENLEEVKSEDGLENQVEGELPDNSNSG